MKILLINTLDKGGAAKSCIRLHQGLLDENVDTKLLLKKKLTDNVTEAYQIDSPQLSGSEKIQDKFKKYLPISVKSKISVKAKNDFIKSRSSNLEIFSYPFSDSDITRSRFYKDADIVNLHWVANFLDFPSFFLANTKPVVWTLHDANPFLGGEHYAERFIDIDGQGDPVPRKYTTKEIEESEKIIEIKRNVLQNVENLHIVCPSRWLKKESEQSRLFSKFPHYHIPYGIPSNVFRPLNRDFCRDILNIPKDKFVILFVSESLSNFRKGYIFLKRSIEKLSLKYKDRIHLCAIGVGTGFDDKKNKVQLGTISDERLMAIAYSAADIFVIPSLEDNLPNTMIESLMCGTPVIGFPTGGISETIINSFNGYVCPEISVKSLQQTIENQLLSNNLNRNDIRNEAMKKYNMERQAKEYISLYKSIKS